MSLLLTNGLNSRVNLYIYILYIGIEGTSLLLYVFIKESRSDCSDSATWYSTHTCSTLLRFNHEIIALNEAHKCTALPNACRRSVRALS
jgi:hypothetical protein